MKRPAQYGTGRVLHYYEIAAATVALGLLVGASLVLCVRGLLGGLVGPVLPLVEFFLGPVRRLFHLLADFVAEFRGGLGDGVAGLGQLARDCVSHDRLLAGR